MKGRATAMVLVKETILLDECVGLLVLIERSDQLSSLRLVSELRKLSELSLGMGCRRT